MKPSIIGQRRFIEWLRFCESVGWTKDDLRVLADMFWKHKDRNGNLKRARK